MYANVFLKIEMVTSSNLLGPCTDSYEKRKVLWNYCMQNSSNDFEDTSITVLLDF